VSDDDQSKGRKILAAVVAVAVVVLVVLTRNRLGADFVPPDRSFVGPNLVASVLCWAIVLISAYLLWPPTRRRLHRFVDGKLEKTHAHLEELVAHARHQTRIAEDHYEATVGRPHPDAGKLDKV
jgi:type III secretory pathway component EscR